MHMQVLCIFIILVDSHFGFEGKTLVMIAPVPDHPNFFSYSQTLFANIFCIYSISNLTSFVFVVLCLKTSGVP